MGISCMYVHMYPCMCGLVDESYVKKGKAFHGWNRLHREVTT